MQQITDFLKKHFEKLLLALALVVLIVSAWLLSNQVDQLNTANQEVRRRQKKKGNDVQSIPLGPYSNVLAYLQSPPLWTNPIRIVITTQSPTGPNVDNTGTVTGCDPACLTSVTREPFKLLFKAYTGDGHNFQLNLSTYNKTFYVADVGMEVADKFDKTAYFIKDFKQKKTTVNDSQMGRDYEKDVSELTLQRTGDDPIVLTLNQIKEGREPVAWVRCEGENRSRPIRKQQTFTCKDKTWKVVDINQNQMLIIDAKTGGETKTIPISTGK